MLRIRANGLRYRYSSDPQAAAVLQGVELALAPGEFAILSGPTGSGKSTLMTLVGGLRRHQEGELEVLGRNLAHAPESVLIALRREIGFIFQDHNLFDALTARETLQLAMRLRAADYRAADYVRRPEQWLRRVGLAARMDALPAALSTGQRQCVAIARALVNDPLLILADEPTASLDANAAAIALDCLREAVRERGASVLMITHDNRHFARADRVLRLLDGRLQSA